MCCLFQAQISDKRALFPFIIMEIRNDVDSPCGKKISLTNFFAMQQNSVVFYRFHFEFCDFYITLLYDTQTRWHYPCWLVNHIARAGTDRRVLEASPTGMLSLSLSPLPPWESYLYLFGGETGGVERKFVFFVGSL